MRIDATAVCATDLEVISHGPPALIQGGLPFNKNFTPGHEYMGTVVSSAPASTSSTSATASPWRSTRAAGAASAAARACIPSALNYGMNYGDRDKGHRANGFTTDGGFAEYAVNHVNTLVHVPDDMSDEEATLIVTAGTVIYGLDVLGGLIAGQSVVVTGPGAIGLMGVGVAKALGASPVVLTGTRDRRLEIGRKLGADDVVDVSREEVVAAVMRITAAKARITCSNARARPTRSTTRRTW